MNYRNAVIALLAVTALLAGCPKHKADEIHEGNGMAVPVTVLEGTVDVTPSGGGAVASYTPHSPTRFELADNVKLIWFRVSGEYQISLGKWDGELTAWPLHDVYEDAVRGSVYDYVGHGFGIMDEANGQLCLAFVATDMVEDGQRVLTLYPSPSEVTTREGETVGKALARASKAHLTDQREASSQKEAKKK